jgi:hypothetical protein
MRLVVVVPEAVARVGGIDLEGFRGAAGGKVILGTRFEEARDNKPAGSRGLRLK